MARLSFFAGRERLEKFFVYVLPGITALTVLLAKFVEAVAHWRHVLVGTAFLAIVDFISEIAVTLLACEILFFLIVERSKLLVVMEKQIEGSTFKIEEIRESTRNAEAKLVELITSNQMKSMLRDEAEVLYRKIVEPPALTNLASAEEAYTTVIETIKRISVTIKGRQKDLILCPLYSGAAQPERRLSSSDQRYFERFDSLMSECIASTGPERWNVRLLFNVTSIERLEMVIQRLDQGTEGYQVRAICVPGMISQLSPMIIDGEDAFLAAINNVSYRVDTAIHLTGKDATAFVKRFVDSLWDAPHAYRLRTDTGPDRDQISLLRQDVLKMQL